MPAEYDLIGPWTEVKLDILREYAAPYSKILTANDLYHLYIDAYAAGGSHISRTTGEVVPGSPSSRSRAPGSCASTARARCSRRPPRSAGPSRPTAAGSSDSLLPAASGRPQLAAVRDDQVPGTTAVRPAGSQAAGPRPR